MKYVPSLPIFFLNLFLGIITAALSGCGVGTKVLKRGQEDNRSALETPPLWTVPPRPAPIDLKGREQSAKTLEEFHKEVLPDTSHDASREKPSP